MKSTGIVRNVDELGRVVVPKELRKHLGIDSGEPVEIYADGEKIVLMKYEPACIFCSSVKDVLFYRGKKICQACLNELQLLGK